MKKVYIWGTGALAETCWEDLLTDIELLGFVESNPAKDEWKGKKVISGEQLIKERFDYIILANGHEAEILEQFELVEEKVVHYRMLVEVDKNGKVLCYRKGNDSRKDYLFLSQRKLEIVEDARKIMPYISVGVDDLSFLFYHKDILIPNEMLGYGRTFSREEIEFFYEISPKKETGYFLEIGANVGTSSIYFKKKLIGSLQHICFEPLKENVKCLKANCILNECEDIKIENLGLSNREQEQNMYIFDGAYGSSMVSEKENATAKCKFVTLDKYVEEYSINKDEIAYIWVDVQGHEVEVVEGALQTLKDSPASLYIEFNIAYLIGEKGKAEKFLKMLEGIYNQFIVYEQYVAGGNRELRTTNELSMLLDEIKLDFCNILLIK